MAAVEVVAQSVVAMSIRCVRAESMPLRLDGIPARWKVAVGVAMAAVCEMVVLSDVDGGWIGLAVALGIADRLHIELAAGLDHDTGE